MSSATSESCCAFLFSIFRCCPTLSQTQYQNFEIGEEGSDNESLDKSMIISTATVLTETTNVLLSSQSLMEELKLRDFTSRLGSTALESKPLEDECVICLECFDESNPVTPTLCRCGLNRSLFHRPCLLLWHAKFGSSVCPSCATELFYE